MASNRLLALYHALPAPARSAAATLRGWYLNRWRYGRATARLIEEALERESWSAARWSAWREERLGRLLHRAATQVPYYQEYWVSRRRRGDRASWEVLEHWPILDKDAVGRAPRKFVAVDCDRRRMFHEQTSGTTGTPLDIWRSRETVQLLYAIAAARTRVWDGVPAGARYARLGGQLVVPIAQRRPPFWVWNAAMRQLYMSSYHLAPDLIPSYLDALQRYRISYLAGYTSSLVALAQEALASRRDLPMAAAYTNAEPLSAEQRATIAAAFHSPVRETYGMAETVAAGSECPSGRLHLWPEVGIIEVVGDGEFVCTGLLNTDMPLIRYRVGDRGRLGPAEGGACECGRSLPILAAVDGRVTDLLITRDGRQVFWLNPVFYGLPVRQSQIVQERLDLVRVRIAPATTFGPIDEHAIVERLRQRLGDVRVVVERVAEVPRTSNGKVRAVVCGLSAEERESALQATRSMAAAR